MFQALVIGAALSPARSLTRMLERTGRPIHTRLAVGVGAALTASFRDEPPRDRECRRPDRALDATPELVLVLGVA